ncbi:26S proteasome non-ATPase regulatory subunit 9 [Kwoniella mangroviensis CBS 8886]|uniref:uncharacterized protein n=1 Tax=Kwoniella mangroviensis CBS 8507 TaxID=1296122 RepID=UPI00080CC0AB|nr:26S proteasome non-ATPase regulatory subunit 9 [Kwoniella mangroviensis CBS 8507]OCF64601.1 26S proteasome non-ATPase regulatory subunit 9 [Kwoniella mangroviensis CBS 8507]OCF74544.1 26S proteasome non-ATPase regulatory subunit 9 [Kwoniella mangroviensis CBS 8886]
MQELVWPPPPATSSSSQPANTSLPLPHPEAYEGEPREYARALMQRKDDIEKEIEALKDVLNSHGVTQQTQLIDNEGYPRGDIDIYAIRHARSSLVRLQNDRQTVSDLLATALQDAFSRPTPSTSSGIPNGHSHEPQSQNNSNQVNGNGDVGEWPEKPIARVNTVTLQSPASQAGLQPDDLIYDFAGVTHTSQGGIQAIGAVVSRSEGVSLKLLILRGDQRVTLHLTPRNGWGGRGSLGCHILPI